MRPTSAFSVLLASFCSLAYADYGVQFSNGWFTGPTASNSFIRESNTTLILPEVNAGQKGDLALWPGMGTSENDLIQALALSNTDTRWKQYRPRTSGRKC